MGDYKKLVVWQKAHQLVLKIYKATADFPQTELYGLTSQIRRAGVSIPANIAEGSGRESDAELLRFVRISMGSAYELEYHLLLAHDLDYLETQIYRELDALTAEVIRMLAGLIKNLNSKRN